MTILTILRHAKSSWDQHDLSDFDRPLNGRGRKSAPLVGREMRHRKMQFDLVLASPAERVRETLEGLAIGLGQKLQIDFEPQLYGANVDSLFKRIRALPEAVHSPLLVGHNPGLHELLLRLTRDDEEGLRNRIVDNLPTAAVALIELPAVHWAEVEPDSGVIRELILPRDLD